VPEAGSPDNRRRDATSGGGPHGVQLPLHARSLARSEHPQSVDGAAAFHPPDGGIVAAADGRDGDGIGDAERTQDQGRVEFTTGQASFLPSRELFLPRPPGD